MPPKQRPEAAAARKLLAAAAARERRGTGEHRRKISLEGTTGAAAPSPAGRFTAAPPSAARRFTAAPPSAVEPFTAAPPSAAGRFPAAPPPSAAGPFPAAPPSAAGSFPATPPSTTGNLNIHGWGHGFGASTMQSPHQWMDFASLETSNRDTNPVPAGGFTSYLQNQSQPLDENFHFVGEPYTEANGSPTVEEIGTQISINANIDNEEAVRTQKKLVWTPNEDARLMSAWLKCSFDPVQGNDKKNEQYLTDVLQTYNATTPIDRKRTLKPLKDRFHRINKLTDLFHAAYLKARRINQSGFNEEKWIVEPQQFYESENSVGRFRLMDVWYSVRSQPKWLTYNDGLKRKRKTSDQEGVEEEKDFDLAEIPRPPGQKAVKKALYESKKKEAKASPVDYEELQILKQSLANRAKSYEVQQKVATERLEAARLNKEAKKLELKGKMMDTYNCLLAKDVQLMSEEEKAEHVAMLKYLKSTLYPGIK